MSSLSFRFSYMPCLEDQLTNEAGIVNLFALPEDLVHNQTLFGSFAGEMVSPIEA